MARAPTITLAVVTLLGLGSGFAIASGTFTRSAAPIADELPDELPALTGERILLIHDGQREHLIRELAFVRAAKPFAELIPTPTRPQLEQLDASPFPALRAAYPFAPRPDPKHPSPGVELLETTPLRNATAFVLAATDAQALRAWLDDNGLVTDPASDAWLARYVELGFYFVALRYEPPATTSASSGPLVSDTLRISFATPLPYLPYRVVPRSRADTELEPHRFELWFVGAEPVTPVGLRERDGVQAWVQPLRRGPVRRDARASLSATLGPELAAWLPEGPLITQVFEDHKRDRDGFGDVLFAYEQARPLTPELSAELEPLLGLLDPALIAPARSEP